MVNDVALDELDLPPLACSIIGVSEFSASTVVEGICCDEATVLGLLLGTSLVESSLLIWTDVVVRWNWIYRSFVLLLFLLLLNSFNLVLVSGENLDSRN